MGTIVTMQDALGIVIFAVVGIGAVIAILTLFTGGDAYDEIGRGGLSLNEDRVEARHRRASGPGAPAGDGATAAQREDEIRQMLEARNARRIARGRPAADVEAELAQLTRPGAGAAADPGIREEVRQLVEARNARRVARGAAPLDVESEIERQLRDLAG